MLLTTVVVFPLSLDKPLHEIMDVEECAHFFFFLNATQMFLNASGKMVSEKRNEGWKTTRNGFDSIGFFFMTASHVFQFDQLYLFYTR